MGECCWFGRLLTSVPLSLVLLLATCALLLYIYGNAPYGLWKKLGVPGPDPAMFLGNAPELYGPEGARTAYKKWQNQYGRLYGLYYFRFPALVITDPELMKQVLVKDFHNFRDRFSHDNDAFTNRELDTGVFFAKGDTWKRVRNIITPSFSTAKLRAMTFIVNKSAERLGQHVLDSAQKGTPLDVKRLFGAFAMDVVTGTGFSIDVDSLNNLDEPFTKHGRSLFTYDKSLKIKSLLVCAFPKLARPLLRFLNSGFFKMEDMEFFNTNITRLIEERKVEGSPVSRVDFLQLLTSAIDETPGDEDKSGKLTRADIVAQGIMLFIAGYETASSTLQFLSYELARHPEILQKLAAEIDDVIGKEEPTYDLCQNLKYTEAVLNETLRMYPPLTVINRRNENPITFNGWNIPAHTGFVFPLFVIGRDPEFWENPNEFNPDRFLEDSGSDNGPIDPFTFIPFGGGPRICIGMKLGLLEMKIALVQVLRRVVFTKATPEILNFQDYTNILQPSEPITIYACPRSSQEK